jgi:hypothetical protein
LLTNRHWLTAPRHPRPATSPDVYDQPVNGPGRTTGEQIWLASMVVVVAALMFFVVIPWFAMLADAFSAVDASCPPGSSEFAACNGD